MKKTKKEKGITLIALIITIVVLLILAVVTIGAIKNSKIITHSQKASNDYTVAQEKEQIQLALGEWQLQKNTSGNTQTFKSVMESELSSSATVGGEEDGPLTVIFKKTENEYTVTSEGKVKSAITISTLEKYMFGEDLTGRNLEDIFTEDGSTNKKDKTLGIEEGDITMFNVWEPSCGMGDDNYFIMYFKCNNRVYKNKITVDDNYDIITDSDSGITEVYNYNNQETRVGKKVAIPVTNIMENSNSLSGYISFTILYDDDEHGLQILTDGCVGKMKLGEDDSNYKTWTDLDKTEKEFEYADLNNSNTIDTDIEKALYSYNNAINNLNKSCEVFTNIYIYCATKLGYGLKEENVEFTRNVGSNPNNKDAESDVYESDNLKIWPINNTTYSAGITNKRIKGEDLNYESDVDRMVALGIADSDHAYWLGSRTVGEFEERNKYAIRYWGKYEGRNSYEAIFSVSDTGFGTPGDNAECYTRSVIKLKSDVQFNGSGTEADPYTIAE